MKGFVVLLTVIGLAAVAMPGAAVTPDAAAQADGGCSAPTEATNGGGGAVEPGQQLAGVLGEQQSAVDAEIDDRGFEARLGNATTDAERAKVIAAELDAVAKRLDELEGNCETLTSRLDANEIGEGTYRTRMGRLDAKAGALSCRLNRSRAAAEPLPSDLRDEHAINETVFDALDERVETLDGFVSAEAGDASSNAREGACDAEPAAQEEPQPYWPW